jgi:hypothetical protein
MDDHTHFSVHAMKRMRQRGCDAETVLLAIAYGRHFHRQGGRY